MPKTKLTDPLEITVGVFFSTLSEHFPSLHSRGYNGTLSSVKILEVLFLGRLWQSQGPWIVILDIGIGIGTFVGANWQALDNGIFDAFNRKR
jgi:hypothetical protein